MNKSLSLVLCSFFSCLFAFSTPKKVDLSPFGTGVEDIRSNLYVRPVTGAPVLLDGDLTEYYPSFSNSLDGMDARKMANFSENLGMARGAYVLAVERRETIGLGDTIFFKMWQMQQRPYQLEFVTTNLDHPGMEGYLEDKYLNTSTPVNLNGRTTADFTVTTDPASKATDRFRIIFSNTAAAPLPLTITYFNAHRQGNAIQIDWKTENESDITGYQVEKSTDGNRFSGTTTIKANNFSLNQYAWVDEKPASGYNYYRLISSEKDGKNTYSEVLKVSGGSENDGISLYPNPVVNNILHVRLNNQPQGLYEIRLLSNTGQLILTQKIKHAGGNIAQTIEPNVRVKKGVYQIEVVSPDHTTITAKVVY